MLLAQAYEELAKGDFVQVSEKGWSATAQMLKAIAQERGWPHDSHRSLYQVVNELRHETGRPRVWRPYFERAAPFTSTSTRMPILGILWRTTFGTLSDS